MSWFKDQWGKIPKKWQLEIVSAVQTFIAAVALQLAMDFPQDGAALNGELISGLLLTALRAGVKALFVFLVSELKKLK